MNKLMDKQINKTMSKWKNYCTCVNTAFMDLLEIDTKLLKIRNYINLKGCRDKGPNISQTNITEWSVRPLHCCFKLVYHVYLHRGRLGGWRWWSGTDETAECRCCHRLGRAPSAMALLGASAVGQSPFPPFPVTADVGRRGTAWSYMPGCEVALFKRVTTKSQSGGFDSCLAMQESGGTLSCT